MNTIESFDESAQPYMIGAVGGGSTGKSLAGILDAVEAGLVPGISRVEGFAAVGTTDSGSSTGRLRRIFGTPAVGDIRRSISALSDPDAAQDFERRFDASSTRETVEIRGQQLLATLSYGNTRVSAERSQEILRKTVDVADTVLGLENDKKHLEGLTLGHLVLTALTLEKNIDNASHEAGDLMGSRAEVIPVTNDFHHLEMHDGPETIFGEELIDEHVIEHPDEVDVNLVGLFSLNPRLRKAIADADKIVIGPGSVYTSMVPALLPEGMSDALADKDLTLVGNLVTQETETSGWTGERYVKVTEKYIGRPVDQIIFNEDVEGLPNAVVFDRESLEQYGRYRVIAAAMIKNGEIIRDPNDPLRDHRSNVEHDMSAVAVALVASEQAQRNSELVNA